MSDLDDFTTPLPSGFRRLSDAEQERFRKEHNAMVRRLLPTLDEMERVRRIGAAEARNAVIA